MNFTSKAGCSGRFRFVSHDCRGLKGSGPDGKVTVDDLFKREGEILVPRHPEKLKFDVESKNKILKRGLSYFLYALTKGQGAYNVSDITYSPTSNPWGAVIFCGDQSGAPAYAGDAMVEWDESDGQYNAKIANTIATINVGRRGITHGSTSGPGVKRSDIYYPTTNPYREIEYILFAQANVPGYATAAITTIVKANLIDGETFTLDDGIHTPVIFEFDTGGAVSGSNVPVDISGATSADDVRDEIIWSINNRAGDWQLYITASDGGAATVDLTHDTGGAIANTTPTDTVADVGFSITAFSGGSALEAGTSSYLDNFEFKGIGMAEGVNAGDGEADSMWGSRSVIGLAPQFQGENYRVYVHEGSSLHFYETGHTVGTYGDGYVQSNNQEEITQSAATDTRDAITASNTVLMANLALTESDVGRSFDIAGSGAGNDGRKTIATVISPVQLTTSEALSVEGNGFTADVVEPNEGHSVFDGTVESEGDSTDPLYGSVDIGFGWKSGATPSHSVGRVWSTGKFIERFRVVVPVGTSLINVPDDFEAQYLPNTGGTAQPYDDAWTTAQAFTSQSANIYNGGIYGYEFALTTTTPSCLGFRIGNMTANSSSTWAKVAELYISEEWAGAVLADKYIKFRINAGTWRTMQIPDGTYTSITPLRDAINSVIRGYGAEAAVSNLGYLWLRGTVAGDNSTIELDTEANGSTVNSLLGFPSAGGTQTGVTQTVRKLPTDALTILYRINISGDLPQP